MGVGKVEKVTGRRVKGGLGGALKRLFIIGGRSSGRTSDDCPRPTEAE